MKTLKEFLINNKIDFTENTEGLNVGGSLDLEGTQITSLPEGLNVGGSLYLEGTQITSLPEGLKSKAILRLDNKCKWEVYVEKKEIKIGCEKHGVTFWKDFFKNKKSFTTSPNSPDYDLIRQDFESALALQNKFFK